MNPAVLSLASAGADVASLGMPRDAVFTATALAAALGSLTMGVLARFPIAQAPGMGLNAFFAYSVVLGMGIDWRTALATHVVGALPDIRPVAGAAIGHLPQVFTPHMLAVVATMLFVDFFDSGGTLMGVARQAGLIDNDRMPRAGRALFADALATTVSGLIGTSSTTAYIESAAGVAVGGRSGFTAVVVGVLFLLALFVSPLLGVITPAVTAPALILVGVLMASSLRHVAWHRFEIGVPAFLTVLLMPLTYSIATGIALGFVVYPITLAAAGRRHEIHPLMIALAIVFTVYFTFLRPG